MLPPQHSLPDLSNGQCARMMSRAGWGRPARPPGLVPSRRTLSQPLPGPPLPAPLCPRTPCPSEVPSAFPGQESAVLLLLPEPPRPPCSGAGPGKASPVCALCACAPPPRISHHAESTEETVSSRSFLRALPLGTESDNDLQPYRRNTQVPSQGPESRSEMATREKRNILKLLFRF